MPPDDAEPAAPQVSVIEITPLGYPLVSVRLRLSDGTVARMTVDRDQATFQRVSWAAAAVDAVYALRGAL